MLQKCEHELHGPNSLQTKSTVVLIGATVVVVVGLAFVVVVAVGVVVAVVVCVVVVVVVGVIDVATKIQLDLTSAKIRHKFKL